MPKIRDGSEVCPQQAGVDLLQPNPKFDDILGQTKERSSRFWLFYHAAYLEAFGRLSPFARLETNKNRVLNRQVKGLTVFFELHPRIPLLEALPQLGVEHSIAQLQQEMRPRLAPPHLLLLHEPLAHEAVDGRFHE